MGPYRIETRPGRFMSMGIICVFVCVFGGCSENSDTASPDLMTTVDMERAPTDSTALNMNAADMMDAPMLDARILSAYHGLDALPPIVNVLCETPVAGEDGMPVVFSVQLDIESVSAGVFAIETSEGERVTPLCASLAPAIEPLELRTVLLMGPFGAPGTTPRSVEVVGPLLTIDGVSLEGLKMENISPLEAGPRMVLAERFSPDTEGLIGECPEATLQVIQATWDGGIAPFGHGDLSEVPLTGVSITLETGETIEPIALADDDPDNHLLVCLDADTPAVMVQVDASLFEDPGHDPNPDTQIEIFTGIP